MYCGNCGKEIKDESAFCPYCGVKIGSGSCERRSVQADEKSAEMKPAKINLLKKGGKRKIWVSIILVVCLIAGYFGYTKVVEYTISSEIEQKLAWVQNGVDAETAEKILIDAVPQLVGDEWISNFILTSVKGEDVIDVYYAMMRYMSYEVVDVTKVEFNHYQAVVRIHNLKNALVAARAVDIFMERYNTDLLGKAMQVLDDVTSDKSKLVAEMMQQAADDYYSIADDSCWISKEHVIDITKNNGEWVTSLDYEALIYNCLGLA